MYVAVEVVERLRTAERLREHGTGDEQAAGVEEIAPCTANTNGAWGQPTRSRGRAISAIRRPRLSSRLYCSRKVICTFRLSVNCRPTSAKYFKSFSQSASLSVQ